jgi:Holliday junction resolvase
MNKVDANQKEIVRHLRMLGCSVAVTSDVAHGFPDLVVGWNGKTFLIELKDGKKVPSKQKPTPEEIIFESRWKGQYAVCNSLDEIIKIIMP